MGRDVRLSVAESEGSDRWIAGPLEVDGVCLRYGFHTLCYSNGRHRWPREFINALLVWSKEYGLRSRYRTGSALPAADRK